MKLFTVLTLGVVLAVPLAASAQTSPTAPNPAMSMSPEMAAKNAQIRTDAKAASMKALSPAHVTAVQAVVDQLNAGKIADPRAAYQQIDAILTPEETSAVLAIGAKMRTDMRALMAPPAGASGPSSPPPSERRDEGATTRRAATAGAVLTQLMMTPDQMSAMRARMPAPAPRPT